MTNTVQIIRRVIFLMRVVEAIWEKRNLGVSCVEIEIGKRDSIQDLFDVIGSRNEQYMVAKVIAGRTDVFFALQERGFSYIETLFETSIAFSDRPKVPDICKNLVKDVSYHIANDEEERYVLDEIRKGTIFSTDRISVDPYFNEKLAGQRYAYWMQDVMNSGNAYMFITDYCGEPVGFNIYIDKKNYFDAVLGGLFTPYLDSGLGFANSYCGQNASYDIGARKIISHVSSNNNVMFQLHLLFGMKVKKITNTFVRHN